MHILLVRFSSMGDIVLQTATINWLRSLFGKDLRISFVTSQEFVSLVDSHQEINHVLGFNRRGGEKWKDFISKIDQLDREHPIDLILDLHATLRSWRLKCSFWSTPALTVDKRRWERFFLTKLKGLFFKRLVSEKVFGLGPQVERIIDDLESVFGDERGVWHTKEFRKGPHREMTSLSDLPTYDLPSPYITLAPSASFEPKRWPVSMFADLAQRILQETSYHVVILGGPGDDFCSVFNEIKNERIHNLQGKTNLKESMSILSHTELCIGNDSGMNHITEAYGIPCVTIFGPTDPRFGFSPHGEKSVFLSKELWCKPCSTTGKSPCFRDKQYCMLMISVDEVWSASKKILEETT